MWRNIFLLRNIFFVHTCTTAKFALPCLQYNCKCWSVQVWKAALGKIRRCKLNGQTCWQLMKIKTWSRCAVMAFSQIIPVEERPWWHIFDWRFAASPDVHLKLKYLGIAHRLSDSIVTFKLSYNKRKYLFVNNSFQYSTNLIWNK